MHKIPIFAVMVGIPGSGKSSMAARMKEEFGFDVVSTEDLRKKLLGNENDQSGQGLVFLEAHRMITRNLTYGIDTVFEATSCRRDHRQQALQCGADIPCMKVAMVQTCDLGECLLRNDLKYGKVPSYAIRAAWKHLQEQPVEYSEGWHYIIDMDMDQLSSMIDIRDYNEGALLKKALYG